ncbi:MazG-like family protein [Kitasatospora sp. NPDC087314]|uniref:MazG-like family protein n=1 Tax=Kitasatospora sp. NPDC087314 TaxID=3364068 RepID=UPI003821D414
MSRDGAGEQDLGDVLHALSTWIDASPANRRRNAEALLWSRIAKVGEEAGEAVAALIGATGANPRKGTVGDLADVERELLDVATAALLAVDHLCTRAGQPGIAMDRLDQHIRTVAERAGRTEDAGAGERCCPCGVPPVGAAPFQGARQERPTDR